MNQMECVCINGHEHSLGDTALVFPLLLSVFSCSQLHMHCYITSFHALKSTTVHQFAAVA